MLGCNVAIAAPALVAPVKLMLSAVYVTPPVPVTVPVTGEQLIDAAGAQGHAAGASIHIGRGRGIADRERPVRRRDT